MYIHFLPREEAIEKVNTQIGITEKQISDFKTAVSSMEERGVSPAKVKIAEYALRNQEARLQWLNEFYNTISEQMEE